MKNISRIAMSTLVFAGLFLTPVVSRADARCPWLNAATAGWVLGGEVQMSVTPLTPQGDATCEFSRGLAATAFTLSIAVHTMDVPSRDFASYLSQCDGTRLPLKAIGNEAIQCVPKNGSGGDEEQIIGRVRERVFVLTIHRSGVPPATLKDGLREDTRNIAGQVAGSLF